MYNNLLHLYNATRYSITGLIHAFKKEYAFRCECLTLLILILTLLFQEKTFLFWIIIVSSWLLVMSLELLNSAIEKSFDLITQKTHPLVRSGKDMGSAAVFIAIFINILIWIYVFIYT